MLQELSSSLYQLAFGNIGFVIHHFVKVTEPINGVLSEDLTVLDQTGSCDHLGICAGEMRRAAALTMKAPQPPLLLSTGRTYPSHFRSQDDTGSLATLAL